MEYRLLGSSGCAVSALALGTLTYGNETDQAASFSQLDRFTEAGGTLVDSADVYADGRAEEIVGRWLAARPGRRELVVLATKGRFPTDESPNGHGLSRRHLSLALDASLRRLNVETIDLYQLHAWGPADPSGGDAALPGRCGARREDQLRRAVQLHRLATAEGSGYSGVPRAFRPGVVAAAVPPVGPRGRMGDRARLPGRRARHARLVPAGQRVADWQVQAGRAGPGRHPGGGERRRGDADLEPARPVRADLAGARRGAQGGRGPRRVPCSGSHRMADGPARRIVGN